jgi:hypothetical protein
MTALQTGFEYTDINIDGDRIVMTERECPTGTKFLIGNRFFFFVQTFDANKAFDFFRNYAPLLSQDELKDGWLAYEKALNQRCDDISNAFWNYLEGKTIKMLDRKGGCFCWVS